MAVPEDLAAAEVQVVVDPEHDVVDVAAEKQISAECAAVRPLSVGSAGGDRETEFDRFAVAETLHRRIRLARQRNQLGRLVADPVDRPLQTGRCVGPEVAVAAVALRRELRRGPDDCVFRAAHQFDVVGFRDVASLDQPVFPRPARLRGFRQAVFEVAGVHQDGRADLFQVRFATDRFGAFPCLIQRRQQHPREDRNDCNDHKDNLSNILICSILAMTRRKAEGELSDESVDLCTSEQREG